MRSSKKWCIREFVSPLLDPYWYALFSENACDSVVQNHQKDPRPLSTEWSYLKIPYISERLNHRITSIFRKEGIPERVAHKLYTLRRALSHNNKERTCTRANCSISDTRLCLVRNAVYQITCNNCNQHYIRSTTRFIHDRVREHLNNDNSSVKKHLSKCQNKVYKGIEIKSIVLENDPANCDCSKRFTYETTNLTSTPERNAANSRTFYSKNYFIFILHWHRLITSYHSLLFIFVPN